MIAGDRATGSIRVARIIARLNIGGPSIQAITLTKLLEPRGYRTTLIRGSETADEGSMDYLADRLGVRPVQVGPMQREPAPSRDLLALARLVVLLLQTSPHIVHTHQAKAGTLGRLAALITRRRHRAVLVHTYHGHSLTGYFGERQAAVFRAVERFLARRTHRLIAVSEEVRDDLVALGVAPAERFKVVWLGFELEPFQVEARPRARARDRIRAELGIPRDAPLVTLIARLVPIKRIDRFLRVAGQVAERDAGVRFLVLGDGELRERLKASPEARALGERLVWAGFRRDVADVCFASDMIALTSDMEGTPVSLIEAQAAAVPVVTTRVGGVASIVEDGVSGHIVDIDDEEAFTLRLLEVIRLEPDERERMGARGRARALARFDLDRLVEDIDTLYQTELTAERNRHSGKVAVSCA